MFTSLHGLTEKGSLSIILSRVSGGDLRVCVYPMPDDDKADNALKEPLIITGSPTELDAQFANIVSQFKGERESLESSLEAAKLTMEAAKKAAQDNATKAGKPPAPTKSVPIKPTTKSSDESAASVGDAEKAGGATEIELF